MINKQPLRKFGLDSMRIITFSVVFIAFFSVSVNSFAGGKQGAQTDSPQKTKSGAKTKLIEEPEKQQETLVGRFGKLVGAGKIEEAKALFISELTPNELDSDGKTALHYAALAKNRELADFVIRLGTSIDTADAGQNTALTISANLLDSQTAATLASQGANIYHKPGEGDTPAQIAIKSDNLAFLGAILTGASMSAADNDGKTILHYAVEADKLAAVDTILRAARDARGSVLSSLVNKKDAASMTPLDVCFKHRASITAAEISASLITAGGVSTDQFYPYFAPCVRTLNYNVRTVNGISPLHFSIREKYTGWTDYLLQKNADPNIKSSTGDTPLMEAAAAGDLEAIQKLLGRGAQPNTQNAQGDTAMHISIPVDVHRAALELLLRNGGDPNIRNVRGAAPLHIVVELNRPADVLEILFQYRADVSVFNIEGKTPLFVAVEQNRTGLIPLLLANRADIFAATNQGVTPFEKALQSNPAALEELITEDTVLRTDSTGNTALIAGVKLHASADVVRRILDRKAFVNARNLEGDTALHLAVRQNDPQAGEVLISRNADIFLQNTKGESPLSLTFYSRGGVREWMFVTPVLAAKDGQSKTILHWAAEWKLDQVIPTIVSRGAAVDAQNVVGETPLFVAVRINSATTVRALIQAGASLSIRDTLGNTALHTAVRYDAQSAAETLISARVDINAYNLSGNTPLHEAVRLGKYSLVSLFVQRNANLEARDASGNTPLLSAVVSGNFRIADHLVRAGADVNTRNNDGNTPLHIAVREERSDLVSLLLDNQAQIHAKNADGESPFTIALRVSPRMVLSLITKGREQTDEEGRSPLHIALMTGKSQAEIESIAGWAGAKQLYVVDRQGQTPLRYAVNYSNWEAAKFLTEQGSDPFSVARDGKTPAEIVLTLKNRDAIRAIFGSKAIAASDTAGNTVLHYAAKIGATDVITFLIELGAARGSRNASGETPAEIAARWGHIEAANILR